MYNIRYSYQIPMKLKLCRQIFQKYSNIKFNENPFSGSRVLHADGRTDRRDVTVLRVAFSNFAYVPKNPTFFESSGFVCIV